MVKVILLKNKTVPNDDYQEEFLKHGVEPVFIPLLSHGHSNMEDTISYLTSQDFLSIPHFIITSQRAVECFDECIKNIKDEEIKRALFSKVAYTVGPATAKALRNLGFNHIRGGEMAGNGSKLADIILEKIDSNQRIVFFTGMIRKDIIPKKLKAKGIKLEERVIYATQNRPGIIENFREIAKPQNSEKHGLIVFFSPQGTEQIVQELVENESYKSYRIVSIGPTTQEYLTNNNLKTDTVPHRPDAESLLESVMSFIA